LGVSDDRSWERYEGVRRRISHAATHDEGSLDTELSCCPGWTGKHVLAHLVGLAGDLAASRVDGYASDAWTATQVGRWLHQPVHVVLAAWAPASAAMARAGDVGGLASAALAFGDAVVHEADLRLTIPFRSEIPAEDLAVAVKTGVSQWRAVLAAADAPALHIEVPGQRDWWLGDPGERLATTLVVHQYELFRVLYGRRSIRQVRGLAWTGDPSPFLQRLPYPFSWANEDVVG
jgi:hypothetical protein